MKKFVDNMYAVMYDKNEGITFNEKVIITIATLGVLSVTLIWISI